MSFRHFMMVALLVTVLYVVTWSMGYADSQDPGSDVSIVIGAVNAPIVLLMGYAMKLFTGGKDDSTTTR